MGELVLVTDGKGRNNMTKIKHLLRAMLPEEKKNLIPCVAFGSAILTLGALNVWKWVLR